MSFNEVRNLFGKPYYENDNCLIYNIDCIEAMRSIPEPLIDLTVTSPPYNIGKEYEKPLSMEKYVKWSKTWINEVYGITKDEGAFWLNLGYVEVPSQGKAIPLPYLLWDASPFYMMQEVIWHYGAGVASKKSLSPRNEKFLWYVKNQNSYTFNLDDIRDPNVKYPNQKKNGKLKCNPLGKNPTDVWQFPKVTSGSKRSSKERTPHPAQFPQAVIERIIKGNSNKNDLILDPFIGSGTTAVIAMENDRKVIGFELKEEYCEITANRIENYLEEKRVSQLALPLD